MAAKRCHAQHADAAYPQICTDRPRATRLDHHLPRGLCRRARRRRSRPSPCATRQAGQEIHKMRRVLMLISRRIHSLISSCALPSRKTRGFRGEAPRPARPAHMLPRRKLTIRSCCARASATPQAATPHTDLSAAVHLLLGGVARSVVSRCRHGYHGTQANQKERERITGPSPLTPQLRAPPRHAPHNAGSKHLKRVK